MGWGDSLQSVIGNKTAVESWAFGQEEAKCWLGLI